jgi:hypothetical protein
LVARKKAGLLGGVAAFVVSVTCIHCSRRSG